MGQAESTFTSRFVFPMMSLEGSQMWLVGLWPMSRERVLWAKFCYALAVTSVAAMTVTFLSIRALDLAPAIEPEPAPPRSGSSTAP